ncbi:MAG: methylglyoxal synthase [Eubacteriales bacterium]|nr:methylglyoxal synthase [Eubacteriales bacterium]
MNIVLIANDVKKILMQNFCVAYKNILKKHELYATASTGAMIEQVTNLTIHKYAYGPLGGAEQICIQIENNMVDLVIFLRDPNMPPSHRQLATNIFKQCDMHNIPISTNLATAELFVQGLINGDLEKSHEND